MTKTTKITIHALFLGSFAIAGCGGAARHADEPTLASQAQPLTLDTAATGELASACDRTVWSFRPTSAGRYRFEAQSDVPLSMRLFSMAPDLYLDTGTTSAGTASVEESLETDTTYAVTLAGTDCRATHYAVRVTSL
jgi:hypothetical protein